ncbi:alpha/beta fold hydrolase [Prescottella agglutinans]|uniref:Pimeloyl-ACP methyl ester carboxylesterase n=1 Tax=Prescottella agglutinans TaxID=1644129 RepID=A0ABT6MB20_9NOCA|nr:alpha/beta fold hydrolase [Prescottella agglutinans]MDH6281490.1 pimeloyl-ACP methyl ester carboxylesterase [Prescottella agglutinans]
MRLRRATVLLSAAALGAVTLSGCSSSSGGGPAPVAWGPCSDLAAYVTDLGIESGVVDRLQCGSVDVPLDYNHPDGRTVELALSRVVGTDPAAPTTFVNPGGPGVEGRSMAATVASDLGLGGTVVGIDLRGIGSSTGVTCTEPDAPDSRDDASLATYADEIVDANRDCIDADPDFVESLTTANAARDLDRVRQALGLDTVDYVGVSWGTVLGAELQSRFPGHLHRVVLDSMDYTGTSTDEALRALAAADPDVPPEAVPEPADLGAVGVGGPAPDDPEVPPGTPPAPDDNDAPVDPATADFLDRAVNGAAGTAYICNSLDPVGDTGDQLAANRAINAEIARNPQRRIEFPADSDVPGISLCSGWPLPAEPTAVANTGTDLLIIGHRIENVTPYEWALDAQEAMGGQLLTIEDGVHGSTVGSSCGGLVTEFLYSGELSENDCTPS